MESWRILSRKGSQCTDPEGQEERPEWSWVRGQGGSGEGRLEGRTAPWEAESSTLRSDVGPQPVWRQTARGVEAGRLREDPVQLSAMTWLAAGWALQAGWTGRGARVQVPFLRFTCLRKLLNSRWGWK